MDDSSLVDPASVSVIGVVGDSSSAHASTTPPPPQEKKPKKDKIPAKPKKSVESASADSKISELDQKWLERFNRLEALIMSKSFHPTFSSDVRDTPTHSPPARVSKDSELFFQLTHWPVDISPVKRTGPDTHAAMQPSTSKLQPDKYLQITLAQMHMLYSISRPVSSSQILTDPSHLHQGALVQTLLQSTSRPASLHLTDTDQVVCLQTPTLPFPGISHLANYPPTDLSPTDRPSSSCLAGSESPPLQQTSRRDSISSLESQAESDFSD